jgi:hypothetical protein
MKRGKKSHENPSNSKKATLHSFVRTNDEETLLGASKPHNRSQGQIFNYGALKE